MCTEFQTKTTQPILYAGHRQSDATEAAATPDSAATTQELHRGETPEAPTRPGEAVGLREATREGLGEEGQPPP